MLRSLLVGLAVVLVASLVVLLNSGRGEDLVASDVIMTQATLPALMHLPNHLVAEPTQLNPSFMDEIPQTIAESPLMMQGEQVAGSISGVLVTSRGEAVRSGFVGAAALNGRNRYTASVGQDGRFLMEDVFPGPYHLVVHPESLPEGIHPPMDQLELVPGSIARTPDGDYIVDSNVCASIPPGYFGTPAVVSATGGETQVEIVCLRPSIVTGYLQDTQTGVMLSGVHVRLTNLFRKAVHSYDTTSDEAGKYEFIDVGQGYYRISVFFDKDDPKRGIYDRFPYIELPQIFSGDFIQQDILLGGGGCTVSGRVVDELGQPYEGVWINVHHSRERREIDGVQLEGTTLLDSNGKAETSANGSFVIDRLYDGANCIHIGGIEMYETPLGERAFGEFPESVSVQLAPGQTPVGDIVVTRSKPFLLSGLVTVSEEWLEEGSMSARNVELWITRPEGAPDPDPNSEPMIWVPRKGLSLKSLDDAKLVDGHLPDGRSVDGLIAKQFAWECETPYHFGSVYLELRTSKRGLSTSLKQVEIVPYEGEFSTEIHFP